MDFKNILFGYNVLILTDKVKVSKEEKMTEKYEKLGSADKEAPAKFKVSEKSSETNVLFEGTLEQIDDKIEALETALTTYKAWKAELEKIPAAKKKNIFNKKEKK